MREAEATLALHRDRPRAARALNEARAIAIRLGAAAPRRATEELAAQGGNRVRAGEQSTESRRASRPGLGSVRILPDRRPPGRCPVAGTT